MPEAAKKLLVASVVEFNRRRELVAWQLAWIGQRPPKLGLEDAHLIVGLRRPSPADEIFLCPVVNVGTSALARPR